MFAVWLFEVLLAMIYDLSRHDGHMISMFHERRLPSSLHITIIGLCPIDEL